MFRAAGARARLGAQEAWLAKPSTYMNLSGQAVAALASFYRLAPGQVLVVHDEIDLEPGEVRLKLGGGTAGHNGLKSIRDHLSSSDFWRLRLGVGHPRTSGLQQDVADYVLHVPRREEEEGILAAIERADDAIDLLLAGASERARLALAPPPAPRPPRPPRVADANAIADANSQADASAKGPQ
jgi:PTH1 family peptidyl-tRNA hydrolase